MEGQWIFKGRPVDAQGKAVEGQWEASGYARKGCGRTVKAKGSGRTVKAKGSGRTVKANVPTLERQVLP